MTTAPPTPEVDLALRAGDVETLPAPSGRSAATFSRSPVVETRTRHRDHPADGVQSSKAWAASVVRKIRVLRRLISLAVILVLWQVGSSRGWIAPQKFPPPDQVWTAFRGLMDSGDLWVNLYASIKRMGSGLLLGGSLGVAFALIAGLSRVGEEIVDAPLQALRVVPNLALTSLFIIWFGIGETSKIYLIALGAFFPLYLNTFGGIRNVDNRVVEASRIFGLGRFGLATRVMLPGAMPQMLVGLRQSIGVAWLSLVVVETTNAPQGIGSMVIDAREFMRTDIVVVGLLLYAVLGLLTDMLVRYIEKGALSWRVAFTAT